MKTTKQNSDRAASGIKALLFDFGNTLAFLDYELLAREFSRLGGRESTRPRWSAPSTRAARRWIDA